MGKRILALLCMLAMLAGMFVVPATAVETTDYGTYQVGYSKKDLNPWVAYQPGAGETLGITEAAAAESDYIVEIDIHEYDGEQFTGETTKAKFIKIPAAGDSTNVTNMIDDNGDGYIGYGDGIFVTCTSVTDSKGNTVLYLSVDGLNVNGTHADKARTQIYTALSQYGITKDRIMITNTHAHASPSYGSMRTATDPALSAYYTYTIEQMKNAAVEAFTNKSEAAMSKGQIDASRSMLSMGYKDTTVNTEDGWRLNFSRHYNVEGILQETTVKVVNGEQVRGDWSEGTAVDFIATSHSGRPFQQLADAKYTSGANAGNYVYDVGETIYKTNSLSTEYVSHVSEADDTLYVLQFTPTDKTKDPIVLINWRAHATMNGNGSFGLSSDFINALRYRLENNKTKFNGASDYCVGFWQGAAGNITSTSTDETGSLVHENGWKNVTLTDEPQNPLKADVVKGDFYYDYYDSFKNSKGESVYDDRFFYTAKYGYLLAMVSLDCLDSEMSDCVAGTIATKQVAFYADYQVYSVGLKAAYNSDEYIIDNGSPFAYTYTDGKTYIVNSKLHGDQIKNDRSGGTTIELNVIALGSNVAMVTLPGEPFDRYSDDYVEAYNEAKAVEEAGGATVASQWNSLKEKALADNDWLDLVGGTYGMPFVLGYANSAYGYLAEAMAYDYNTFDETDPLYKIYGPGSYEGNTAFLAKGTGEQIIAQLGAMLQEVAVFDATINGEELSIGAAISAFDGSAPIKLIHDITAEVTVNKDVVIDLNGFNIKKVTVKNGCTLQCMDSQTDDYTVEDAYGYGKIAEVACEGTGKIASVPAEDNGYLMLSEDGENGGKNNYSFHRVDLEIDTMTLHTNDDGVYEPGVYYKSNFRGDEIVAANVETFGIALSVSGKPTNENIETSCMYTEFTGFNAGNAGNQVNSTLLRGIMKEDRPLLINNRYAKLKVYGSAYVKVDGEYIFGTCREPSLKDLIVGNEELGLPKGVDAEFPGYEADKKANVIKLYQTYEPIMQSWDVPNIQEGSVMKVLVVGNSHGLDATRMLAEVFETEIPDQEIVVGALYYSGCTIKQHAEFMTNGEAEYIYHKNTDGTWEETSEKVTADVALTDEKWDYVIMQQSSNYAGQESYFIQSDFMTVINHIDEKVQSDYTLLWNMTWATSDDEDLFATAAENNQARLAEWYPSATDSTVYDKNVMYNKITEYAQEYIEGDKDIDFLGEDYYRYVIPSGTAVQYAHEKLECTQKDMYRDYTHMTDYGRLMVGYLWYAKLMEQEQISSVGVAEIPAELHHNNSTVLEQNSEGNYIVTDTMRNNIKQAVNWALAHPYTVEQ